MLSLRSETAFRALMCCLALAVAASAQPSFSIVASNVDSNGRNPGHPSGGDSCNGVVGPSTYSGPPFPVGKIRLTGTAQSTDPAWWNTYVDELCFSVIIRDSGGVKKAQWNSYPVKQIHSQFWYHNPVTVTASDTTATQNASSLGTILPGDQIEVRFWESLDDMTGPSGCVMVDATWTTATTTFYPATPSGGNGDIYVALTGFEPLVVDTDGSDFDTSIAIFDSLGTLIDFNDDGSGVPGGPSMLTLDGLPPGEYYLCVVGGDPSFDDGFQFVEGPDLVGGDLVVNYNGGMIEARLHDDAVVWYPVVVSTAPCPGDLDGDGLVNLNDLAILLAAYGSACN